MNQDELNYELTKAVANNNLFLVWQLVDAGADVNVSYNLTSKQPVLMKAFYNNNLEMVKYLLSKGADPTIGDNMCLISSIDFFEYINTDKDSSMMKWLKDYETQKEILTKFPHAYNILMRKELLNKKAEEEFKFIISAQQLNLL